MTKKKPKKPIQTSFYEDKEYLYEQVTGYKQPMFIKWNKKTNENHLNITQINTPNNTIKPYNEEAITNGIIRLPTEPTEYQTTQQLLKEIQEHIQTWLDIPPLFTKIASYYILLTWIHDKLHTIPYLRALGDTGTGKTRFQDTIGGLCYKPTFISGAVTPAPIYRLIQSWGGTLIIDEADIKDSNYYNEIITILNSGFEKGKGVVRCEKNTNKVQYFKTYGPKLIGTRQKFKDKALESRCITHITQQTSRTNIPPSLTQRFFKKEQEIRNKLLTFRFKNYTKINAEQENIELGPIEPRLKQGMSSIAIMFKEKPEMMTEFKTFLQEYQSELIEERSNTFEGMIVNTVYMLLKEGIDEIHSKLIAEKMDEQYPYPSGKKHSAVTIGRRMTGFGFKNKVIRDGKKTRRIYILEQKLLRKIFARYVTESVTDEIPFFSIYTKKPKNVTDVTDVTVPCKVHDFFNNKDNNIEDIRIKEKRAHGTYVSVTSVTHQMLKLLQDMENEFDEIDFSVFRDRCLDIGISIQDFNDCLIVLGKTGKIGRPTKDVIRLRK